MRFHTAILLALLLLLGPTTFAQTTVITPTTTLTAESSNNTSAPDSVSTSTKGIAASGNISKQPFRETMYPGATTKVFTTLLGWFGDPTGSHISVGYNSPDPAVVSRQIEDMQSRGIDGTFLAWYGVDSYENTTAQALKQQSELHSGFNFAIMIDWGTIKWDSPAGLDPTQALVYHMNYLADNYFSSPAYVRVNGQPVVIEFGLEQLPPNPDGTPAIDWSAVRAGVRGNPLVIFRNSEGYGRPLSDGGYAWGPADPISYLDGFYSTAVQNPGLITFGGSAKGFNDTLASWGTNRFTSEQCGQTWLNSINDAAKYYSASNQLPFMMVATWNDYEEGTTIESGIDNCLSISASATNSTIVWLLDGQGQENTLDHYTVFVSTDGQNLMPLADVPTGTTSLDLSAYVLPAGNYTAYVKAVGKNSLTNHISAPVTFGVATPGVPPVPTPAPTPGGTDFSVSANPATQTISRGQSSNYSLTVTPIGKLASPVTFSCSGLPSGASCLFASNPVVAGVSPASTALTITTSVTSASLIPPLTIPHGPRNPAGVLTLSISAGVFGLFGSLSAAARKRHFKIAMVIVIMAIVIASQSGCGTGAVTSQASSTAPATSSASSVKTFNIVVTATSGTTVHSVPLTLTLQ